MTHQRSNFMKTRGVLLRILACALTLVAAFAQSVTAQVCTQHTYIADNPDEGNPGWNEEAQGLAHDTDNWYITHNPVFFRDSVGRIFGGGPRLWKVPVTHDLGDGVDCDDPGAACKLLFDTPLFDLGYNHYGDLDFFEFEGHGYIIVPVQIEHADDPRPAMAFFRADETLEYLAMAEVPGQNASDWVAVDHDGLLISSSSPRVTRFNRFFLNWATLEEPEPHPILFPVAPILLQDAGGVPLEFEHPQGGQYSDNDAQLLYFSNGFKGDTSKWGVHVLRTRAGSESECGGLLSCVIARRIERSHRGEPHSGFWYEFDNGFESGDEPEGLTFWDLDADGRAPGPGGQLHVMKLDNDVSADDVHVKHYRLALGDSMAPEITCPADVVAECSAREGVPAGDAQLASFFSGVSALDLCDEQPAIGHDAAAVFGLGTSNVTFTATDDVGNAASCVARVTVEDTRPPAIVCPPPITVECTGSSGISAGDTQLASFFSGVSATDICDGTPSLSNNAPGFLPLGPTVVTFTATDDSTNASSCGTIITVADTTPPQISVTVTPTMLWPPDHKMIPVTASVAVFDRCDASVSFELLSITSDEADNGQGDGDTSVDIQGAQFGTADSTFALRAERSGGGDGRIYTIVYRATDASGNQSTATALVRVPI